MVYNSTINNLKSYGVVFSYFLFKTHMPTKSIKKKDNVEIRDNCRDNC